VNTDTQTAAENALALLRQFTSPQGIDDLPHFDHAGFLAEMEARAASVGRKLTKREQRTLARMVATYCEREGVVS
jgi:hypothetical protein